MLDTLSLTRVPIFMTFGELLCLQQRQNGSRYKECQPMTSLWRFTPTAEWLPLKGMPADDVTLEVYTTSSGRATDVISCHFDVRFNVNDVAERVGDTFDMLDSLSPTSVPSFMTIDQLLCLQQRQNGSHYKECQPMTSRHKGGLHDILDFQGERNTTESSRNSRTGTEDYFPEVTAFGVQTVESNRSPPHSSPF
ncbi:hypothetical protein DPMN_058625 [Dreissena polymorpha]|uniref:Uncharacterized protein n=1 Tax=Dreissena polymorpha TaxID=45954 RepID=A0A9D4HFN8_DREPO|nr:hypothetical protein DPMN_058625 [Dreissena polymorpha]